MSATVKALGGAHDPEAYAGTGITHVAGVRVRDGETVLRVVSEGGGAQLMKPYLDFLTVLL
ncbi:Rossmann-like domain-containing protein [Geomonas sp. RF6]|uniref:Rossmann-like domain-containing protein n=1 Tax=Geomonas sp. RF6 TaxID=2897342 RepID=UPI003FA58A6C